MEKERSVVTPRPSRPQVEIPKRLQQPKTVVFDETDFQRNLAASFTLKEAPDRAALEAMIERAKDSVRNTYRGGGGVVVGRIQLDGPGNPTNVHAQMPILPGGYFAGPIKSLSLPIGFRHHQYAPLDAVLPTAGGGSFVDIGTIQMKRLTAADLLSLTGKIALEGDASPTIATVSLSVTNGPVNTPGNGTSARRGWPAPIKANVAADGSVSAEGFSPIDYYCSVSAAGYVKQARTVRFQPGIATDLGVIRLERPKTITLSYVVTPTRPFDLAERQTRTLQGGERWKATPEIFGWDLEFKQEDGAILAASSYGGLLLKDLGKGRLQDFSDALNMATAERLRTPQKMESGHVYLQHQQSWNRWIAFEIAIQ